MNNCVDDCSALGPNVVPKSDEMKCECAMGSHPAFEDYCDRATEDCFVGCECNDDSEMSPAGECMCTDTTMV
jgi:hypothetical protein